MASNNHICEYRLREKITLTIYNGHTLVVQSNRLTKSASFDILDSYETGDDFVYGGDLGSPWMPGTSFILKIRKHSPFGLYSVTSPNKAKTVNITTTCKTY